jgi:hypothetical protein
MITLRYHIASLSAVLLTLGLGIWIGLAIGSPDLVRRQTALIKESNDKLDIVLSEREQDAQMLEQNRKALSGLVPHFTHGLLYGKRVAIIRTGDYPDAAQAAADALAQTGATVTTSMTISDQFDEVTVKQQKDILGPLTNPAASTDQPGDGTYLFQVLVLALKNGTANNQVVQDAVDRMSNAGLISVSGDFQQPVDLIIVVGGSASPPGELQASDDQARERTILEQMVAPSGFSTMSVVGCEPFDVGTSSIPLFQEAGIGSVDCVDEPLGILDLVYALHGETAAYGIKSSATLVAPASLETAGGSI